MKRYIILISLFVFIVGFSGVSFAGKSRYDNGSCERVIRTAGKVVIGTIHKTTQNNLPAYKINWYYFAKLAMVESIGPVKVSSACKTSCRPDCYFYEESEPVWMPYNDFYKYHPMSEGWRQHIRNPHIYYRGKYIAGGFDKRSNEQDETTWIGDQDGWSVYKGNPFIILQRDIVDNTIPLKISKGLAFRFFKERRANKRSPLTKFVNGRPYYQLRGTDVREHIRHIIIKLK